ncbi:MAG TPA: MarR family transcriptional regulator [Tepidisphaeraceae bacterium]|jgi:DNA-binding MarR family transcriptional regulator
MQRLQIASDDPAMCAQIILDGIPTVFQFIRQTANRKRAKGLAVQQFRALAYVQRRPGDSLSMLAEYLGLSLAATSRLIDSLVGKKLVLRKTVPSNRRQVELSSTKHGQKIFSNVREWTRGQLTERLKDLPEERRKNIAEAMLDLQEIFQI